MSSFQLLADQLKNDARVIEAKRLITEAYRYYQTQLQGIKAAHPELKITYEKALQEMAEHRGSPLYHPYLGSGFGKGALVELLDGSVKYDLIGGIGVHFFGHSYAKLLASSIDSALEDTIMQGNLQQNQKTKELMNRLKKSAQMDHVFLTTSGAMACENALKIIFQKKHPAFRLIAFDGCFMGRTLALSQITDKPNFREGLPPTVHVDYIPFFDPNDPKKSIENTLLALKKHLARHPKEYAAICFEPVQGEKGFFAGSKEFFHEVLSYAKQEGLAIFADEVQTFARTYELFAFHYFALQELVDVVTIGKVAQCCATFWNEPFNPRQGLLSQTFTASTSSIFACDFFMQELLSSSLYGQQGKIAKLFHGFKERLEHLKPLVKGPFGIGSMIAFTPFDGDNKKVNHFVHKLFDNGVIAFVAGSNPTRTRFLLPAAVMNEEDINPIMNIVEKTLKEVQNDLS